MKCAKCEKEMELKIYGSKSSKSEGFIYECSDCGVLQRPKKNVNLEKTFQEKRDKILRDMWDFGILIDTQIVHYLVKHPNPFPIISLLSKRDNKVITKSDKIQNYI